MGKVNYQRTNQRGQVFLVTLFILGIVGIAITASLATSGITQFNNNLSESTSEESLYASRAGIEETLYALSSNSNMGSGSATTITSTTLNGATYTSTISGTSQTRIATATGIFNSNYRKIQINLTASPSAGNIVLSYAAQTGQGGISMSNGSQISGVGGTPGNVYSNGSITGSNTAKIIGNAWAVSGINPSGGNITITNNAYGSVINNCTVNGNTYSPVLPTSCTVSGSTIITPAPSPLPMPTIDIGYWQNQAANGGTLASYSLSSGNATLGPKKITGDVTISNTAVLTITGAVWVYGTFTIANSAQVKLDNGFGQNGTVILLDHPTDKANNGKLVISNSGSVSKNAQGGYILFISTNQHNDCSVIAASFSNQSANTAIVANDGCVQISNSGSLVALAARQLDLANGAQITYDTGLSTELYVSGPGVGGSGNNFGWAIQSWNEIP